MKPVRTQRKRAKGWRMPENTVYVGRPTRWGNPFAIGPEERFAGVVMIPAIETAEQVITLYREWLLKRLETDSEYIDPLRGKNLACWCPPGQPCHADILLEIANA